MRYIIAGPTIINDVVFADGTKNQAQLGGSVFCVAGLNLWCEDCLYVSNVGADFKKYYGAWMDANGLSYDGLNYSLPHTQYTTLVYGDMGLHDEISVYPPEIEERINSLDIISARQIADLCGGDTQGIYIEAPSFGAVWNELNLIRERCDVRIMWELPTSAAENKKWRADTMKTLGKVDIYSINLPETMSLFDRQDEAGALESICALGIPCFFRVGEKGSYMILDGRPHFAPSVTVGPIVDATGCGNASTAAALYGYCEGMSGERIAALANISAAYNLLQYGPYPAVGEDTRKQAAALLEKICGL